jgi:hypothetical protein
VVSSLMSSGIKVVSVSVESSLLLAFFGR